MTNKGFFIRRKILIALIAFLLVAAVYGVLSTQFIGQAHASEHHHNCSDCCESLMAYSFEDIQRLLSDGGQVYQNVRVYSEGLTGSYQVPIPNNQVEDLLNWNNGIQPLNTNPFPVTRIMYSGRPHYESIVIVLMGDAFTAEQYVDGNGNEGIALTHARAVMSAMIGIHPFGIFSDFFTVYMIHAVGQNQVAGINGYLGTVNAAGTLTSGTTRQARIAELASSLVVDANHIDMIQVISNSVTLNGFAFRNPPPLFPVRIAVASIVRNGNPPGGSSPEFPNGTLWHFIFIHEFGHSFGNLSDERGDHKADNNVANITSETNNNNLKWIHWVGHRRVLATPPRFGGWGAPAGNSCMMAGGNYTGPGQSFCGVCVAELTRRMALISGETFHGRLPNGNIPNTHTVAIADEIFSNGNNPLAITRILDSAFHGNTILHTLNIPTGISEIGDFAFLGATGLRRIYNLRPTPQLINNTTFAASGTTNSVQNGTPNQLNRSLITVHIPAGTYAAYRAAGWTGFNLVESPFIFTVLNASQRIVSVRQNPSTNAYRLSELNIPERVWINGHYHIVTQIAANGFANQTFISTITLPPTVTYIGRGAFLGTSFQLVIYLLPGRDYIQDRLFYNTGVRGSIVIPYGVWHIGYLAFSIGLMSGNSRIYLPESVESIADNAFFNPFPGGSPAVHLLYGRTHIQDNLFANTGAQRVILPYSLTHIGANAFQNLDFLQSIQIPGSVISVGANVFLGTWLWNSAQNNSVVYVSDWAVGVKGTLAGSYAVRNGTVAIADRAFSMTPGVSIVTIPSTVTAIGSNAFLGINVHIVFAEGRTQIQAGLLQNQSGVMNVTIPATVTSIGHEAFTSIETLRTVRLERSLLQQGGITALATGTAFSGAHSDFIVLVHYGSFSAFQNSSLWEQYKHRIQALPAFWMSVFEQVFWYAFECFSVPVIGPRARMIIDGHSPCNIKFLYLFDGDYKWVDFELSNGVPVLFNIQFDGAALSLSFEYAHHQSFYLCFYSAPRKIPFTIRIYYLQF